MIAILIIGILLFFVKENLTGAKALAQATAWLRRAGRASKNKNLSFFFRK